MRNVGEHFREKDLDMLLEAKFNGAEILALMYQVKYSAEDCVRLKREGYGVIEMMYGVNDD